MSGKSSEFKSVGESLDTYLRQMGAPPAKAIGTFEGRWAEVVGPALAEHTRPGGFSSGVLSVICDDSAWASQISWSEGQIKARISDLFEGLDIKSIQVRIERSK